MLEKMEGLRMLEGKEKRDKGIHHAATAATAAGAAKEREKSWRLF